MTSLFDCTFSSFITPALIKIIYVLEMILVGIGAVVALCAMVFMGPLGLLLFIVFVLPAAFLTLMWLRLNLELVMVAFRIADHVKRIADKP